MPTVLASRCDPAASDGVVRLRPEGAPVARCEVEAVPTGPDIEIRDGQGALIVTIPSNL